MLKLDKEEINRVVMDVTCEHLCFDGDTFQRRKTETWEDLGADSLDEVELVMSFEEEFGCEFKNEVAEKIRTPQQAIDHLLEIKVALLYGGTVEEVK